MRITQCQREPILNPTPSQYANKHRTEITGTESIAINFAKPLTALRVLPPRSVKITIIAKYTAKSRHAVTYSITNRRRNLLIFLFAERQRCAATAAGATCASAQGVTAVVVGTSGLLGDRFIVFADHNIAPEVAISDSTPRELLFGCDTKSSSVVRNLRLFFLPHSDC